MTQSWDNRENITGSSWAASRVLQGSGIINFDTYRMYKYNNCADSSSDYGHSFATDGRRAGFSVQASFNFISITHVYLRRAYT